MKRENQEEKMESVKWQACINRLIPSLPLKAYSLSDAKDSFWGTSHSGPFSLKMINFYGRIFLRDYSHWGNGFLLSLGLATLLKMMDWSSPSLITPFFPTYFHYFIYKAFLVFVVFIFIGDPLLLHLLAITLP